MKPQEAIDVLERERNKSHWGGLDELKQASDAWKMAIEALNKQIPLKPKEEPDRSPLHNKRCPSCNKILTMYDWQMPYCKMCGRAIDWG